MKLLLDQGLPRTAASILRERDIDAIHTGEIGYATAEDAEIIEYARREDRIIATLDSDFHTLLALSNASSPSVIRIRIERLRANACAELIEIVLRDWKEELEMGVMLTVQADRIRVRRLPLLP